MHMCTTPGRRSLTLALSWLTLVVRLSVAQPSGTEYFETKIRPLLVARCQACHSATSRMADLDLSSAEGFQRGGNSGVLINGLDPSESRLLRAVSYESQIKMPPTGRLKAEEIDAIREWVRMGAPWPADKAASQVSRANPSSEVSEQRKFWSFQSIRKVATPAVRDREWGKNPIDA